MRERKQEIRMVAPGVARDTAPVKLGGYIKGD